MYLYHMFHHNLDVIKRHPDTDAARSSAEALKALPGEQRGDVRPVRSSQQLFD
jgi:hypothetical protein